MDLSCSKKHEARSRQLAAAVAGEAIFIIVQQAVTKKKWKRKDEEAEVHF